MTETNTSITGLDSRITNFETSVDNSLIGHSALGRPPREYNLGCISTVNNGSTYTIDNFLQNHGLNYINGSNIKDIELGDYVYITHEPLSTQSRYDIIGSSTISKWWIAGIGYMNGMGYINSSKIAITLIPHKPLFTSAMHNASTSIGYLKSDLRQRLKDASTCFNSSLGNYMRGHILYLGRDTDQNGISMAGAGLIGYTKYAWHTYTDTNNKGDKMVLLSESQIRGFSAYGSSFYENMSIDSILPLYQTLGYKHWIDYGNEIWTRTHVQENKFLTCYGEHLNIKEMINNEIYVYPFISLCYDNIG